MKMVSVILASGSPRRSEILRDMNLRFEIITSDVEEDFLEGETALVGAKRLALDKGMSVAKNNTVSLVISADTVVSLDGEIMGKPTGEADARRMLKSVSGVVHQVVTGLAFVLIDEDLSEVVSSVTDVKFRPLSEGEIDGYLSTGEWEGKAGGYAIQGAGGKLVERCDGSFSNVVGLPVTELLKFASSFGYERLPWE
jgi:septum formation protein